MKKINITLQHIASLSDRQIINKFAELRWGVAQMQVCPKCGLFENHQWRGDKQVWCCKFCRTEFSVTSGTQFANHRIPLRTILMGIALVVNSANSISADELMKNLGVSQKTAWLLRAKIRKALSAAAQASADGVYVLGTPYKLNEDKQSDLKVIREKIVIRIVTRMQPTEE